MLDMDLFKLNSIQDKKSDIEIEEISSKDIAIIGMALRFPNADSIEEFWRILEDGVDCIGDIPEIRKNDINNYLEYSDLVENTGFIKAAYMKEIDKFDCGYFRISPKEAELMDPHHRMFMEVAIEALEDAGYGGNKLAGSRTGVYVGLTNFKQKGYSDIIAEIEPGSLSTAVSGNLPSMIPSRISYFLDLKGPSMAVDTACSSSLTAVHIACQALRNGECDMALTGSVKIHIFPLNSSWQLGIESSDGKTKAFDESADGTGIGEGVAALLLKPYNKAVEDGDNIYAIIKGSAVNQDGSSIGITAPNSIAQADVIQKAWENAGIDPETITYIEAHGTGTKLGDPIEIDGIQRAFEKYTDKKQFCSIGSLKTNIGHLLDAAV
jgi:acyl transferase domain-containing protein